MKTYITILSFTLFIFTLILGLSSCGNENFLTSPPSENKSNIKPAKKTTALTTSSIDQLADTMITLPKSKITISVNKNVSIYIISAIDNSLQLKKNSNNHNQTPQSISPNLQWCPYDTVILWETEMQYKPVSGKYLGISNDLNIISLQDAKNIYGFSMVAVNGFDNIASAKNAGFNYQNIMVAYINPTSALATLQDHPSQYPECGYYEIDEPLKYNFSYTDTKSLETLITSWNTGAKVMITDYNWPNEGCCNGWSKDAGAYLAYYQGVNYYMMCDQYTGNCCGSDCDFWDKFTQYYGAGHVISNWLENVSNQSNDWDCCFKLANGSDQNIKQIWLWAGAGDLTALQNFCGYAWMNGWLLKLQRQKVYILENTSGDCSEEGPWVTVKSYYTGQIRWVSY